MKITRTKKYVLVALIIASVLLLIFGARCYLVREVKPPKRKGAGGPAIEASDRRAQRWVEEMSTESPKETLSKLTDAFEYLIPGPMIDYNIFGCDTETERQKNIYKYTIHYILSNRRFRKAFEDLKKMSKKEAAKLLTQSIQENLAALRKDYQGKLDLVAENIHKSVAAFGVDYGINEQGYYRSRTSPKHPPGTMGRCYGMFSYFLLAAQLELRDVRPAIEDVVRFAKEEFALFNSLNKDAKECMSFRSVLLEESLYHPSLLVTATLCDPLWNKDLKKQLLKQEKLITKEIVDHRARTTEYDMPGREGWVPIEPFKSMLTIRYYQGVSEEQLNTAFP
jgi:hypothetical protein